MNNFCEKFGDSFQFKIEVEAFVSKKNKKKTCAYVFGEATDII